MGNTSQFNGISLFGASVSSITFQIGANDGEVISVTHRDDDALLVGTVSLGHEHHAVDDRRLHPDVAAQAADFGAVQNRLSYTLDNLATYSENLTAAQSTIQNVDMASEKTQVHQGSDPGAGGRFDARAGQSGSADDPEAARLTTTLSSAGRRASAARLDEPHFVARRQSAARRRGHTHTAPHPPSRGAIYTTSDSSREPEVERARRLRLALLFLALDRGSASGRDRAQFAGIDADDRERCPSRPLWLGSARSNRCSPRRPPAPRRARPRPLLPPPRGEPAPPRPASRARSRMRCRPTRPPPPR